MTISFYSHSDYARVSHPFAAKSIDLRGHIGNVFATDRKKVNGHNQTCQSIKMEEDESGTDDPNDSMEEDDE